MKLNRYFIDTSSLFKRYIIESGTEKIDALFEEGARYTISNIAVVEFISNLKRLTDVDKVIDSDTYNLIKKELFNDIGAGTIEVINITSDEIIAAIELIDIKHITPIDSIQLAFVINLNKIEQNAVFVCSDKKLCNIAENYKIKVLEIN